MDGTVGRVVEEGSSRGSFQSDEEDESQRANEQHPHDEVQD